MRNKRTELIKSIYLLILIPLLLGWNEPHRLPWQRKLNDPSFLHRGMKKLTDIIVYDIYSPPVASRIYAYASIAAYEAARVDGDGYRTLIGQLKGFNDQIAPPAAEINSSVAAVQALLQTGIKMVISEDSLKKFQQQMEKEFRATGIPEEILKRSIDYGNSVSAKVLAWAAKDRYKETRSFEKYSPTDDSASWKPTPPAYMRAVEPHWNKMRPFLMDSASQFRPAQALIFSIDTASGFYREAKKVYTIGKGMNDDQRAIANFWDCNPFKINLSGHVMFATKKISPGGHWINIAAQACQITKADFKRSAEVYACLSIGLADAFISCWDEKYRSMVIRPETYINQYIDPDWMPALQTPPFPEYPSGHSVVSATAAVILTKIFGNEFKYLDATEEEFGLPARKFTSFWHAAKEAAISRFYGGIHYMPAIENGMEEGRRIGEFVLVRLSMHEKLD